MPRSIGAACSRFHRPSRALLVATIGVGVALRLESFRYPGYSLDEDLTALAVRGIQQSGLPLLPSGILNDRGVAYSYLAWSAGQAFGDTLNSYRLISLLSGVLTLIAVHRIAARVAATDVAYFASLLVAIFPVHIAVSGWARFYSLAAAAYACTIACFLRTPPSPRWRWRRAGVGLTLLTHELCLTLLPLPMFLWPADGCDSKRSSWWRGIVVVLCGFAAAEALLIALHFLAPNQALNPWVYQSAVAGADHARAAAPFAPVALARPPVLVACGLIAAALGVVVGRRAPLVAALCAASAVFFQLGVMTLVVAVAILVRPQRARVYLPCALGFAGMAVLFWSVHTWSVSSARFSVELVTSLTKYSLAYPLDAVTFFAGSLPVTTCLLAVAAGASLNATGDDRCRHVRALSALLIVGLVSLAVLRLPPHSRYFVVFWPVVVALLIRGVDVVADAGSIVVRRRRPVLRHVWAATMVVALAFEHYAFAKSNPVIDAPDPQPLGVVARVPSEEWADVLAAISPDAVIVTNDEIAAAYHIGRVDYWLCTSDRDLEQYSISTKSGVRAQYAGAQIISSASALSALLSSRHPRQLVVVLFATGRFEYRTYSDLATAALQNRPDVIVRRAKAIVTFTLPVGTSGPSRPSA